MFGLSVAASTGTDAQVLNMAPVGEIISHGKMSYVTPCSTVAVDVTIRKEQIITGPYARYAQKYFGVIAPLSDKTSYEIVSVSMALAGRDRSSVSAREVSQTPDIIIASHTDNTVEFPKVLPDRRSTTTLSPENAAAAAAKTIFDIRNRREELIMGDYSDTVYGAGLQTALERLDKMENDYLELFFGKKIIETFTVRYYVTPSEDDTTVTICRYREDSGLLAANDLSGEPILLECRPQGIAISKYPPKRHTRSPKSDEREYAVPDIVTCRVVIGKQQLAEAELPIFQYGVKIIVNERQKMQKNNMIQDHSANRMHGEH